MTARENLLEVIARVTGARGDVAALAEIESALDTFAADAAAIAVRQARAAVNVDELRDWFAVSALPGTSYGDATRRARQAYEIADAMLHVRAERPS